MWPASAPDRAASAPPVPVPAAPQAVPAEPAATAAGARIRIGFVSAFFRDGTVGRYFESWLTDLPPARFEVHVYCLNGAQDALTARVCAAAHAVRHWAALPPSRMAAMLAADALDVLVYPELGMDARTFALATQRLADRQCAAWGHPVTTGLREIDVYFTAEAMEPPGAQAHYRERVVGLPGLGTRYAMPVAPVDATRARFGLPADAPLLLCPQSLFKIHPDNDALFAEVLAAAPHARLVLFEGRHPAITARYLARLDAALSAAGIDRPQRVSVLPQCGHADYLRLNTLCAAMLDTRHWSGGNTSLDALACALPIVTLPGNLMRGRQSAAMLEIVGVEDTIARDESHYVELAARLAADRAWRDALAVRIAAGRARLFDDPRPVAALARALEALVDA
jgi:CRISPR-associated protein Csy1